MGDVTLVLSGDFRQTLPVMQRGTKADEIHACIKSSCIWTNVQRLRLKTNMRVHLTGQVFAQKFANNLLRHGNGDISGDEEGLIDVENIGNRVATTDELKEMVFPNIHENYCNPQWLCERAILSPTNDIVNVINNKLLKKLPGALEIYHVMEIDQVVNYPTEFLNSLEPPGVPAHKLELKIGAPIMLLRNLDPPALCNGTRLIGKKLMPNVIEAMIITGHSTGNSVLIPRIPIISSDIPFQFKRLQFPVAMSINKSQGQSSKVVGLDLQKPCFSHGQLYVGCSRVGNEKNLYLLAPNGKTKNIDYKEVLQE
ncbi:ATP-dependent DNA helicase PIF1-like [Parasteatoda tepidariorum]|uniref:ATP-dependent DNA helicase PIF1-like n=1 Tax=Parasteatoda tepidariorum TaxID=114398 RepID=UPI001C727546|nr:uncharacterized protein LOC122271881 [Parasteatoda tepidariorum]